MPKGTKRLTPEALAAMTQRAFTALEEGMADGFADVRKEIGAGLNAVRRDLLESEERLLAAVKGIEVRKDDFDCLTAEVNDLRHRIEVLEKRR